MARQDHLFGIDTRVSDILDTDPGLLDVFSRLEVALGFGESTLDEVCTRHGLDALTVCLICNVYSFDSYNPDPGTIARGHVTDVIRYLKNSHRHYRTSELVELEDAVRRLIAPFDPAHQKVIRRFFSEYKQELEKHFSYEEGEVFSYIQALLFGRDTRGYSIGTFEANHGNVDEKLSDLKNLVMKTLPPEGDDEDRIALLRMLYRLQRDLACHTAVEDRILTPMVRYLEHPQAFRTQDIHAPSERNELTEREKEILVCVARGMLNKEIADKYNISIYTVISHRKNITRKTGIKTVAGLTVYALLNGLIDTDIAG